MNPIENLKLFLSLQQFILDQDDQSLLLEKIFPLIIQKLKVEPLSYDFIGAIFIDENGVIKKDYFVSSETDLANSERPIVWSSLLNSTNKWHVQLLWEKIFITKEIGEFITKQYSNFEKLKNLIISPIIISHKLVGIVIFANFKDQIEESEQDLIRLISNLLSSTYRLQDTQSSLGNITQEVYKMNLQLHQLDKLKDDFVSIASHELRTPMTAIRSYVWMALNRSDVPLSEKLHRYLDRTFISTERLINLVNDMLNISRIESGRIEIIPKAFDIQLLVKDVVDEVNQKAAERKINIKSIQLDLPQVFADPDKVHQVLLNLVGNALKFTPIGGELDINYFSDGKMIEVSVKDSGVGISGDDLTRLFKKFGRLDNSYVAAATSGGTGLGLYISKSLVELMKGRIRAHSDGLGKGATFTFSLPVATPEVISHAEEYIKKVAGGAKPLEPVAI